MEKAPKLTRAFICVSFPDEVLQETARVQSLLKSMRFDGKTTEPENLHLTLKFLGEIDESALSKVKEKLAQVKFKPFKSYLEYPGVFSKGNFPSIVWLKVGSVELMELQKQIDSALTGLFKPEKGFMSHLTIARIKSVKDSRAFVEYVKRIVVKRLSFQTIKFTLMSSELGPEGPSYKVIEEYKAIK
jgi:RNA 2',3'-cyclic 3'-phosphodiesterase